MVRTESRVPPGRVTEPVVSFAWFRFDDISLTRVSDSNLSETISATSYRCTDEPTWNLISVSVPPTNLPLMRLPFLSSEESADVIAAPKQSAITNPQTSLGRIMTSPLATTNQ